MRSLFDAGVDVFRLNASHGSQEDHAQRIRMVRELAAERKKHTGILLDLQGPKIRLGTFKDGPYLLQEGSLFTITSEQIEGNGRAGLELSQQHAQGVTIFPSRHRHQNPISGFNELVIADGAAHVAKEASFEVHIGLTG